MQEYAITSGFILWANVVLVVAFLWFAGCLFSVVSQADGNRLRVGPGWGSRLFQLWIVSSRMWGVFFLILGIQLIWLERFATNIPFWDQWGAEGLGLYHAFLQDRLSLAELFRPHNEHRIFWTRIWAMGQFLLNGQWDPHFQTVMNALWQSAAGAVFCELFHRLTQRYWLWLWIPLSVLVFAAPHKGENILFAFQSQFYFLQFFGLASIFLLFAGRPLSVSWWTGWVGLVFSFISLSGGVMLIGTVAVAALLRLIFPSEGRRWVLDLAWLAGAILLFWFTLSATPIVESGNPARPETLSRFLISLIHLLGWPIVGPRISTPVSAFYAMLLWGPWLGYVFACVINRRLREREGMFFWVFLVIGGWILAVMVAAAYSRGNLGNLGYNARYADLFGLGLFLVSALSLRIFLWRHWLPWTLIRNVLLCVSLGVWLTGLYFHNVAAVERLLPWFQEQGPIQIRNTDGYVQTGDRNYLVVEERLHLPFVNPEQTRLLLDDPEFREILPYTIRPPIPLVAMESSADSGKPGFLEDGIPPSVPDRPGERVWGSFHPQAGAAYEAHTRFQLERPNRLPYLVFYLAGDPRAEGNQLLIERASGASDPIWRTLPGDRWLERRILAGSGEVQLEARDFSEESWFAFSEPRELGRYGFYAILITGANQTLIAAGVLLVFLSLLGFLVSKHTVATLLFQQDRLRAAVLAFQKAWRDYAERGNETQV